MTRSITKATQPAHRLARDIHDREPPPDPLNLDPATTYEVLTRRMVEDLATEVTAIRNRIDTMFWVVIVSVVTDALLRMAG
ncbi:MAG TPA: hypothetical protein VEX37_02675 [Thermomicrobiales bacterium]|nr:hypothetical protein [Thermomicrobiales bacterium]